MDPLDVRGVCGGRDGGEVVLAGLDGEDVGCRVDGCRVDAEVVQHGGGGDVEGQRVVDPAPPAAWSTGAFRLTTGCWPPGCGLLAGLTGM